MEKNNSLAILPEFKKVEEFMMFLQKKPPQNEVKTNKLANGSQYLPINYVERRLDEIYSGLWQTANFKFEVIVNEIVGQIDLMVFHPTAEVWLTRTGVASKMIQQKKDSDISDVSAKIKNALEKMAPALKSECIKNAAKSLGVNFGRNLNRGQDDKYHTLTEEVTGMTPTQEDAIDQVNMSHLTDKLKQQAIRQIRMSDDNFIESKILPFIHKNS